MHLPQIVEGVHPFGKYRLYGPITSSVDAADLSSSAVQIEITRHMLGICFRLGSTFLLTRIAAGMLPRRRVILSLPCSSPDQRPIRIVRRGCASIFSNLRIASMTTATPAALSVAPDPNAHESRCSAKHYDFSPDLRIVARYFSDNVRVRRPVAE